MSIIAVDGFVAEVSLDEDEGCLRGVVTNLAERPIRFDAETVPALKQAMIAALERLREEARQQGRPAPEPGEPLTMESLHQVRFSELLGGRKRPGGAAHYRPLPLAYDTLLRNLFAANEAFQSKRDFGRSGAIMACAAVVRFVETRWENPELTAPFLELLQGLKDIEQTVTPEIFATRPASLRRSRSTSFRGIKDFAAALLQVLFTLHSEAAGVRKDNLAHAAREAARHVRRWDVISSEVVIRPRTILEWRSEAYSRQPADRRDFDGMISHLGRLPRLERQRQVQQLLKSGPPGKPKAVNPAPACE